MSPASYLSPLPPALPPSCSYIDCAQFYGNESMVGDAIKVSYQHGRSFLGTAVQTRLYGLAVLRQHSHGSVVLTVPYTPRGILTGILVLRQGYGGTRRAECHARSFSLPP
eukprot:404521-Rhodomonas_salina.1